MAIEGQNRFCYHRRKGVIFRRFKCIGPKGNSHVLTVVKSHLLNRSLSKREERSMLLRRASQGRCPPKRTQVGGYGFAMAAVGDPRSGSFGSLMVKPLI